MLKTKEIDQVEKLSKDETFKILDQNKDKLFKDISQNVSYREIAQKNNIHLTYLYAYLNLEENKQAKDIALEIASDIQVEKARDHLESIEANDTNASVRKKSELSQFELYLAKVKNRKKYDLNYREEKQETNNNIITPQLTLKVVNNSENQIKLESDQE